MSTDTDKKHLKPDFLGIGYHKAGTGWIFKQLNEHPEVSIPIVKEVRYLTEPWHIPEASWRNRLFSKHWHYVKYREMLYKRLGIWLRSPRTFKNDHWYRHFLLGSHSFKWYQGLFDQDRISGEITPAYIFLPESKIQELKERLPELKVILMLRDPVERTWSHIKMDMAKHQDIPLEDLSAEQIKARLDSLLVKMPSYLEAITLWQKYYPDLFIGYQDDIIQRPEEFYQDLLEYLGVKDQSYRSDALRNMVNQGLTGEVPSRIKVELSKRYLPELKMLQQKHPSVYVDQWVERLSSHVGE